MPPKPKAPRDYGPCVALQGGPYGGSFYTVADWKAACESERWGLEVAHEQRPPVMTLYRETDKVIAARDPKLDGLVGKVWQWTGSTPKRQTRPRDSRR